MKTKMPLVIFSGVLFLAILSQSGCTQSTNNLAFEQDQMLYVIDKESAAVSVFTPEGKFSQFIGAPGAGTVQKEPPLPVEIIHYLLLSNGKVGGIVWNDINGNRIFDIGEQGVQNVRIYIDYDNSTTFTSDEPSTLTDTYGYYSFTRVKTGTRNIYIDPVTVPSGYGFTTTNPQTVVLSRTETISDADFGVQDRSARINGTLWDLTDNAGMPDVVVYLDHNNDSEHTIGEPYDLTDSSGNYLISNLPGGTYKFNVDDETVDVKYYQPPGAGTTPTDVFLPPGGSRSIDRTYVHKSTISGVVFDADGNPWGYTRLFIDLNGNGIYDAGEPVTVTDEFGNYIFNNLPPGTYTILIPLPDGYNILVSPGSVFVNDGENFITADFLTQTEPVSINGLVWDDMNGNRTKESGEIGLPGITVFIDDNNNGILDGGEISTITDPTGVYSFIGLDHGEFYIRVEDSVLLNAYNPASPNNPIHKSLSPGQIYNGASFGYQSKLALAHPLVSPTRLTWGNDGNLYISDNTNGSVFIYDSTLTPQGELKKLAKPLGVITDTGGNIYVGNQGRKNVEVYDSSGNLLRSIGNGSILVPNDFAFDRDNNFYILDSSQNTVLVYDPAGNPTGMTIGDPAIFDYAVSIAIGYRDDGFGTEIGELYVADQLKCTIHVFTLDGFRKTTIGSCGSLYTSNWDGKFSGLTAVDIDQYGYIHGLDNNLNVVQVFEPQNGTFVTSYNAYPAENELLLNLQTDISINQIDDRVLMSNVSTRNVETIHSAVPAP